jgi:hypothetical protein
VTCANSLHFAQYDYLKFNIMLSQASVALGDLVAATNRVLEPGMERVWPAWIALIAQIWACYRRVMD